MSRVSLQFARISSSAFVRVGKSPRAHLIPRLRNTRGCWDTAGRSIIILGIVFKLCNREPGIDIGPRCVDSVMSSTVLDCIPANSRHLQRQMGCDDLRWDAVYRDRCKFTAQNATCFWDWINCQFSRFHSPFYSPDFTLERLYFELRYRNTIIQKRYYINLIDLICAH